MNVKKTCHRFLVSAALLLVLAAVSCKNTEVPRMVKAAASDEALSIVDMEVRSFKYSGAEVECRLEVKKNGQKASGPLHKTLASVPCPLPQGSPSGRFIWVRSAPDDTGTERWWVGHERTVAGESRSTTNFCSTKAEASLKLWKPRGEGKENRKLRRSAVGSIPAPLPRDREFDILTVTDERDAERVEVKVLCRVQQ